MNSVGYNSWTSWIALFAVTIIGFFSILPMRLAGLFFVVIIDEFHTDREIATIPIVMFGVLRTLLGPFTGYLGETFGCRVVTLTGCVLTVIGIGGCYFADNYIVVIISFGLVAGVGFAFAHTLMQTILRQHFDKDFNLINGINQAGCCLGAVVMSPVVHYLTKEYGASGMFLILAAIVSNCIPAGVILKNPRNEERNSVSETNIDTTEPNQEIVRNTPYENLGFEIDEETQNGKIKNKDICTFNESIKAENRVASSKKSFRDEEFCEINLALENPSSSKDLVSGKCRKNNYLPHNTGQNNLQKKQEVELISFTHTSNDITNKKNINHNTSNLNPVVGKTNISVINSKPPVSWQLKKLFTDPVFYCIMFINSFHAFICTLNWTVIMDFGLDKGIPSDLSMYFVMFIPVAEICGDLCLNWIVDRNLMSRTNFIAIIFVIEGFSCELIEWSYNFGFTMAGVLLFGFLAGVIRTTIPGMIYDNIHRDKQNMAMASRVIPYGVICMFKTPVVGYFRGTLGSYKGVYDLLTALCVVCALLSLLSRYVKSYRERRKEQKTDFK